MPTLRPVGIRTSGGARMSEATNTNRQSEPQGGEQEKAGGDTTDRFGGGGGKTMLIGYVVLLAIVALVLWVLVSAGHGLKPPKAESGKKDHRSELSAEKIMWKLLLAGSRI